MLASVILWLIVQLVAYAVAFYAVLAVSLGLILAPWFFAGRYVVRRLRA